MGLVNSKWVIEIACLKGEWNYVRARADNQYAVEEVGVL